MLIGNGKIVIKCPSCHYLVEPHNLGSLLCAECGAKLWWWDFGGVARIL